MYCLQKMIKLEYKKVKFISNIGKKHVFSLQVIFIKLSCGFKIVSCIHIYNRALYATLFFQDLHVSVVILNNYFKKFPQFPLWSTRPVGSWRWSGGRRGGRGRSRTGRPATASRWWPPRTAARRLWHHSSLGMVFVYLSDPRPDNVFIMVYKVEGSPFSPPRFLRQIIIGGFRCMWLMMLLQRSMWRKV